MANVRWVGIRAARAQVDTVTVTAADVATTYKITHGTTGNVVSCLGQATTALTAQALIDAVVAAAAGPAPEFADIVSNIAPSLSGSTITFTGPADGAPLSYSTSVSGGAGTIGAVTSVTTPQSPNDLNDGKNYSGGALPSAADTLIFENGSVDAKYNPTALSAIALTRVVRRPTYTGRIGLPDMSELGYIEFRGRYVQFQAATVEWETSDQDAAGQFRLEMTAAGATVAYVIHSSANPATLGNEPVQIFGFASTSTLSLVGGGVWVSPETGQAAVVATLLGVSAAVHVGPSATLTAVNLNGCDSILETDYDTLAIDRGGTCRVLDPAGAGTSTVIQQGTVIWQSTDTTDDLSIQSQGVFDASLAIGNFAVGTVELHEGSRLNDPNAKITKPITYSLIGTSLDKVFIDVGTGHGGTLT